MATETAQSAPAQSDGMVTSNGKKAKLHGRAFYESIGSPKLILAPMVEQSEFVRFWRTAFFLMDITDAFAGMATAFALLPPSIAADEPAGLLAHVPLKDVRREGKLPRLAFPAAQIDTALAARQLPRLTAARFRETSRRKPRIRPAAHGT